MRARHRRRRRRQAPALRRGRRHATGQGRREQCRGTSHVRSGGTIATPPRFRCRQRSRRDHLWPQHRSRGQAPPPTPQHQPQPPHASSPPPRRRWHLCPRRQRARRARHRACITGRRRSLPAVAAPGRRRRDRRSDSRKSRCGALVPRGSAPVFRTWLAVSGVGGRTHCRAKAIPDPGKLEAGDGEFHRVLPLSRIASGVLPCHAARRPVRA